MPRTLSVSGMACGGCESTVEEALGDVSGVENVEADHTTDTVTVVAADAVSDDTLRSVVAEAGYEVAD